MLVANNLQMYLAMLGLEELAIATVQLNLNFTHMSVHMHINCM